MPSPITFCGIDFGTTNSTVAVLADSRPQALEIDPQNSSPTILKSLFYLNQSGHTAVGQEAIHRYLWDVQNIPAKPPILIDTGRKIKTFGPSSGGGVGPPIWVPEIIEVDVSGRGRLLQSLKSVLTSDTFTGSTIFGKFFSIEELLTMMMTDIKTRSEKILGHTLESVVLGRPVRYVGQDKEKLALSRMEKVAHGAGFKDVVFEYEPVGAALNYGIDVKDNQNILVFDFGGGTLDVCIMKFPEKKVISVSGRPIGGDLLNSIIVNHKLLKYFGSETVISGYLPVPRHFFSSLQNWYRLTLLKNVKDLGVFDDLIAKADDPQFISNFKKLIVNDYGYLFFQQVDKAKIDLSLKENTNITFNQPDLNITQPISKSEFEAMLVEIIDSTRACIYESLNSSELKPDQIDHVLVTGGSSRVPVFQNLLTGIFGHQKIIQTDPFASVALGLSLRAGQLFA